MVYCFFLLNLLNDHELSSGNILILDCDFIIIEKSKSNCRRVLICTNLSLGCNTISINLHFSLGFDLYLALNLFGGLSTCPQNKIVYEDLVGLNFGRVIQNTQTLFPFILDCEWRSRLPQILFLRLNDCKLSQLMESLGLV